MKLHLLVLAKGAQEKSHAPYSNFKVGAAIETEGAYAIGCNVENAAYPLCICAERAAIANMVLNGHKTALSIAVIGSSDQPCYPCGACLQSLVGFGNPKIYCFNQDATKCVETSLKELLPHGFSF